jgi:hypothetical protein
MLWVLIARTKSELIFYIYEDWKACLDKLIVHHSYCLKSLVPQHSKVRKRKEKKRGENYNIMWIIEDFYGAVFDAIIKHILFRKRRDRLIPLKWGPGRGGLDGYNPVPKTLNP